MIKMNITNYFAVSAQEEPIVDVVEKESLNEVAEQLGYESEDGIFEDMQFQFNHPQKSRSGEGFFVNHVEGTLGHDVEISYKFNSDGSIVVFYA